MTKYENKSFSIAVGSERYRENWDRIFGKNNSENNEDSKNINDDSEESNKDNDEAMR